MTARFETRLRAADPEFRELIDRIPRLPTPPLPPDWLRFEMLERYELLRQAPCPASKTVLEVGSGAHAIATVPLAHWVGDEGRVVAVERSRWGQFRTVVAASRLEDRVWPVAGDARRLPLRSDSAGLAVCLHGVRSLGGDRNIGQVLGEMLRVSPRILLAESLPIARTNAQRAHLAMYNLREEVFAATAGSRDDLHYLSLDRLVALVERAGGVVERAEILDVDLPHFLAYFPRAMAEAIPDPSHREELLRRWDEADAMRARFGEDHPPVGVVAARRV